MTIERSIGRSLSDPHAFELVFDRHHAAIRRYVARRLSPACADDVAADVFCIAFDQRRQLVAERPDCPVGAWLYGIATNLIRRRRRDERRQLRAYARAGCGRRRGGGDRGTWPLGSTRAAPRPRSPRRSPRSRADERDVLLLYALAELDYQGIADALQIPIGTVRSRLARARRRAARHLAGTPTTIDAKEARHA